MDTGSLLVNGQPAVSVPGRMDDVEFLLDLNQKHSQLFDSSGQRSERQHYRHHKVHPTEIGASKCMDGRINVALLTETSLGIIQPWRNIGGQFDLRWPFYQDTIQHWHAYAQSNARRCLKLVTYHFSKGEPQRGCRGFNYDRKAAQEYTANLKRQYDEVFGRTTLYAVHCGVETDQEALILHGDNGKTVDLTDITEESTDYIQGILHQLYPDMHRDIVRDFIPLVRGNIRHVAKVRADKRRDLTIDAEHQEWVLGVGRGFDWLHEKNMALIVGPFDPNYVQVIKQAAGLIHHNFKKGRTNGHKIVLLSLAAYRKRGIEKNLRMLKAQGLEKDAFGAIFEAERKLIPHLHVLTGVVDMDTRKIEVLEHRPAPLR